LLSVSDALANSATSSSVSSGRLISAKPKIERSGLSDRSPYGRACLACAIVRTMVVGLGSHGDSHRAARLFASTSRRDEGGKICHDGWRSVFGPAVDGLGGMLKLAQIEKVVFVNDWLISTNPTVRLTRDEMRAVTACLADAYPSYSFVFKSIAAPDRLAPEDRWSPADFGLFAYKTNFHIAPTSKKTRNNAGDLALLRKKPFQLQELEHAEEADLDRFVALYEALYAKYTRTHPRLNREWFRQAVNNNSNAITIGPHTADSGRLGHR